MSEKVEQLKGQAEKLLSQMHQTSERIDAMIETAFEIRLADKMLSLTIKTKLAAAKVAARRKFVRCHLSENLSSNKLAEVIGLKQNHFTRSFKQTTGKTPHQFVLEQRVEEAKKLLQTTTLPLAEVALSCGSSSQAHLTT